MLLADSIEGYAGLPSPAVLKPGSHRSSHAVLKPGVTADLAGPRGDLRRSGA